MNEYQRNLVTHLRTLTTQDPPAPWQYMTFVHVGGLEAIGYEESSDLLLIVSSSGRSVVDCLTGDKVARDYTETEEDLEDDWEDGGEVEDWYKPFQLLAEGIGPLAGQVIRLAGIGGGGLPTSTPDRWRLEIVAPDWPNSFVILHAPAGVADKQITPGVQVKVAPRHGLGDVILVCGFSPTGKSFVVGRSDGVDIFKRVETS